MTFISQHCSGGWELRHQGTGRHGTWWEHPSWFADGFILVVSSHGQERNHLSCLFLKGYKFGSSEIHPHDLQLTLEQLRGWGADPPHIWKSEYSFTVGLPHGSASSDSSNRRAVVLYVFTEKKSLCKWSCCSSNLCCSKSTVINS